MIGLLSRIFIKNRENTADPKVRRAFGMLSGILGIVLNLILCGIKLIASVLTGSVSITADAINNLADAASSLVTLIGFRLAGQKPDPSHPFGHGRIEYLSGLLVSFMILFMGIELAKNAILQILDGSPVFFRPVSIVILIMSIAIKLYMYRYNREIGRRLDSPAVRATAADCLSDTVSTVAVLVTMLLSLVIPFPLDGWCGLAVAIFILWSGIRTAKDTLDPLLGAPPDRKFVEQIEQIVLSYPDVLGIHDLVVHDYGPGRVMVSLHAEIPCTIDILTIHDRIDNIEKHLNRELFCEAVIHMDPIAIDNPLTTALHQKVIAFAKEIHPSLSIHDFRIVVGESHTNLIFDMVIPYGLSASSHEMKETMTRRIKTLDPSYEAVIQIDQLYL